MKTIRHRRRPQQPGPVPGPDCRATPNVQPSSTEANNPDHPVPGNENVEGGVRKSGSALVEPPDGL
eukprot:CAMPEP_0179114232 /NCGR_PEP_ID=MMETSP0796-20121207/53479_1 /TAXON_ID=73915 /ORGANISM="Pyrodinium bahamense, Strain pbaha01" /LENGTH=65 /DNA_ID=CAMNT_0020812447 /DNA_START=308 /DNA_END=502 /DNA_ORIENTATION=-